GRVDRVSPRRRGPGPAGRPSPGRSRGARRMSRYFLPHIDRMAGYVPGEQPRAGGFTKLNTNENPYPPSPRVAEAIARALDARPVEVPFGLDWSLDPDHFARPGARLAFVANPNSPSGTALTAAQVGDLARRLDCPLVVDEAYADFADFDCVALVAEHPNVIVT